MHCCQLQQIRTVLLLMLTTALGGTWVLEQPENSVLDFFPPFLTLLRNMFLANLTKNAVTSLNWLDGPVKFLLYIMRPCIYD